MQIKSFGKLTSGEEVSLITMTNKNGMKVSVCDYGAVLQALWVKDKNGKLLDVVTGFDTPDRYETNFACYGATIGRVANRIANAKFSLNGVEYQLQAWKGQGNAMLHSFPNGYNFRKWNFVTEEDEDAQSVTFYINSPDGDQGYPGSCDIEVTYTLTNDNELMLGYYGLSDKDTPFNMTNHSYFNLNGHDSGNILNHTLQILSDQITVCDEDICPTGELRDVKGTAFDFNTPKTIGQDIDADEPTIQAFHGFDHNFMINGGKKVDEAELVATLTGDKSGIVMECYTDLPGVQLYTANSKREIVCENAKGGVNYPAYVGCCLETQFVPNSINLDCFDKELIKANQEFETLTVYRFTTKE